MKRRSERALWPGRYASGRVSVTRRLPMRASTDTTRVRSLLLLVRVVVKTQLDVDRPHLTVTIRTFWRGFS